jgi:hypothetical protein
VLYVCAINWKCRPVVSLVQMMLAPNSFCHISGVSYDYSGDTVVGFLPGLVIF